MVIWFNGYMVIVVYSNQVEWFISKKFIPILLMVIGFYIVIVILETATWRKYNYIDNLSWTFNPYHKNVVYVTLSILQICFWLEARSEMVAVTLE